MLAGHFYFIEDKYFVDFPDQYLMKNHETINGKSHDRPCIFAFEDGSTGIYWAVPFSSQTYKYEKIYNNKIKKFNNCDTIEFGYVLGKKKAFLIQNMCPLIDEYVKNEYIYNNVPVMVDKVTQNKIIYKAKKILRLQREGHNFIFPDALYIEQELIKKLANKPLLITENT